MNHLAFNSDCMELMRNTPDKFYDLAVVDPNYRDENQPTKDMRANGSMESLAGRPTKEYFTELKRVSKEQIIWGANNFELPQWKGFIVWKKQTISENFTMSMCEIASLSEGLGTVSKWIELRPQDPDRIHPTQKPVDLYGWIFKKYLPDGGKVLDTHGGSMSSLISAIKANNIEMTITELDPEYFETAKERVQSYLKQLDMFSQAQVIWQ